MTETVGTGDPATARTSGKKKQAGGLTVRRVFTTEGVHPYDQVTWENRDVVMTNWRDGTVNFEQRGVEFPDFWSVNATNIVTSKYFRGAVGSAQREQSLKQLIDRVVHAYVNAGREHGYFASPADAEVFEHELTWMLLHQVFSFNSPVWFNVGTASKQQVSACFILAVDDTMESILNWYREEGLIFKGGSGAGLNLSRIRSSRELLSSGGTASGPVSFMRGADASAGTIKSGGATRRAAKMVVLDVDHPDIEEFVRTKAREEEKIKVLRDAGFDMDLSGSDITSVQYQNANNSVRVSDEFMQAVESGGEFGLRARMTGEVIDRVDAKKLFRTIAQAAWECADPGLQYDDTINDWHTCPESGRITASNPCSEYLHLDNSSCNLASLNLLKFATADGGFDAPLFAKAVELVITAMDISICFADFPTEAIGDTTRKFRQLGIGYANLGALLMALGHAYDSDGGRALAAAITSLMTGVSYRRSAELAEAVGPYEGYARNAEAHQRVMRKHAAANELVRTYHTGDAAVRALAAQEWKRGIELGETSGWRNAQASVLAPTGCLTADTLVTTDRGLARLSELGDLYGDRWQDVEFTVATDEGPRRATKFYVNGEEPTRRIETKGGYRIQGTLAHRVKVLEPETGSWVWKRLADIQSGDLVPMQLGGLVGDPRRVPLPELDQAYYAGDRAIRVPDEVTADLAELVGYFEGDGRLHAKGIRLCVADADLDVVERLRILSKGLFDLEPVVRQCQGYQEVTLQSVRLARWWQAAGFAKELPGLDHAGRGWPPRVPASVRETNDPEVYAAFLRGVFEADGTVQEGVPSVSTSSELFGEDLRSLLLTLGMATTTRRTTSGFGGPVLQIRLRNVDHAMIFDEVVGFIGERKARSMVCLEPDGSTKGDRVHLPRPVWDVLVPLGHEYRDAVLQSLRKTGGVARMLARRIYSETLDPRLGRALKYLFEPVESNEDGGVQPTFDLSVPDNVTYVANGFVSHNTIGFMMDCDTTGIEPDFSLVKFKKLVGGGSMQIVNQTVPRALTALGYQGEQVEAIVEYIAQHGHVVDAPGLRPEHYEVFDCAVGERSIAPMGHVRMMAAVQPFLSGAISKTVNMPESATVEEVEEIYFQGWKSGLKALAIYRDNCKVGQPLSTGKKGSAKKEEPEAAKVVEYRPVRKRLPKKRPSQTVSFTVGGAEGYLHAGSYPDDGLGEIFVKLGKQGSTLAGVMDAFSMSISVGLQHGIPLEFYVSKFSNLRFEPAGMTDDPDIRIATSVMDYLFRRLALDYLPYEKRAQLGIFTADERSAQVEANYGAAPAAESENVDIDALRSTVDSSSAEPAKVAHSTAELVELNLGTASDAPLCMTCGTKMRPAGSCYACEGCGATSGCS
ncbi:vitamin B12-dependent ribonucleotide reductase [Amycolatopsis regifaucium]|uniref:Vitamin B12-dependent ribonucleotide reductase n=1 Tax=Amycolatopsis regifaucium TaxID=546365 RepID=A0A154MJH2_9PSEU|nr:vitamin B12-dependent ribonucleotide reductase [Amycolatopsis regifaucium]KZB84558.1 ribonucleoside-diphosphate reductase [Amycolatopsis regifaucium]OKA11021.1 ribonucleoside-diphosphate reductase, adenosylcobalamin-dependent [Amycolatopsis regifaucium]SFI25656.1 ribonucleoside-diphosphate reductase class II [Amycolatopsis regifaucium]